MAEARKIVMDPKLKLVELLRAADRDLQDAAANFGQRVTETQRYELAVSVLASPQAQPYMALVAAERERVCADAQPF